MPFNALPGRTLTTPELQFRKWIALAPTVWNKTQTLVPFRWFRVFVPPNDEPKIYQELRTEPRIVPEQMICAGARSFTS